MSVISIETRKANELAAITDISDSSIFMVHDGTGLKRITFEDVKRAMVYPNAGSHNSIYRGKYLGNSVSTAQYTAIRNGTFDDLFIGDYWTIGGINYRIAAFDYYLNTGDTNCAVHHVVIVPDQSLYKSKMINNNGNTNGGYVGSILYTNGLNGAKTTIKNAFSGHVLKHRLFLSNAASNGAISNGVWLDSEVDLMNEHMVYGSMVYGYSSTTASYVVNAHVEKSQLPLFRLDPAKIVANRESWWLRDITLSSAFANVHESGIIYSEFGWSEFGVRPFFCIS